jgi:hypothetical protein
MKTQTSLARIRAMIAGGGRTVPLRTPPAGVWAESIRPVFAGTWRESGGTYPVILAQAAALSLGYRHDFLLKVAALVDPVLGAKVMAAERAAAEAGKNLRVPRHRVIHIFLRSPEFLVLGFEGEKATEFQGKQSLRYDEYLRARNPQPFFAFVARGQYASTDENAKNLRRFVPVDDGRLAGWGDECLVDWLGHAGNRLDKASEIVNHYLTDSPAPPAELVAAS